MKAYFDNMATTQVDPRVLQVMTPLLAGPPGNPHARNHGFGRAAGDVVDHSREKIARLIGSRFEDVAFAPSATIANNIAILGTAAAKRRRGRHILISDIEHASVLETAASLVKQGFEVESLPVGASGIVEPDAIASRLRPDTIIVSVMAVNNEVGTIQPIASIGALVADSRAVFHCDAAQAPGRIPLDELAWADLVTLSSHKAYGPKGAAVLVIRRNRERRVLPVLFGGGQEGGLFPGTLNVPSVAGMGAALEFAVVEREFDCKRVGAMSALLLDGLTDALGDVKRNGLPERLVPHCLSLTFEGIRGETLLTHFIRSGIAVSHGSACSGEAADPSHVLAAIGMGRDDIRRTLRFSPGRFTTNSEVDLVIEAAREFAKRMRS